MSAPRTIDARQVRCGGQVTTRTLRSGATSWTFKYRAGTGRTKSFSTEAEAVRFRLNVRKAKEYGEAFDAETGVPVSMLPPDEAVQQAAARTVLDVGVEVVATKWRCWSPGNRRSRVESMSLVLAELVSQAPPARMQRAHLVRALRDRLLPPASDRMPADADVMAAAEWLTEHSLPMKELKLRSAEQALTAAAEMVTQEGMYAKDMLGHQRSSLSLICRQAMREGLLEVNVAQDSESVVASNTRTVAVDDVENGDENDDKVVNPARVASPAQCRALVEAAKTYSRTSWRYVAYWTLLWMTGMRPSEATGIRNNPRDLHMPEVGWGWANVRRPIVATGKRWTGTGTAHAARTSTKTNKPRRVKLHPDVVAALREHISRAEVGPGQLVFTNSNGTPIDPSAMGKVWRALRNSLFDEADHNLSSLRVYDLRHTAGSVLIKAVGVVAAAEQLGHSPLTLMRVYARCMETDDTTYEANAMEAFG